jgi:hypothetical protein
MIVQKRLGLALADSMSLRDGVQYQVLEVHAQGRAQNEAHTVQYRVHADHLDFPGVFPATWFDLLDGKIASDWQLTEYRDGALWVLGPAVFSAAGFWEQYFDGDVQALASFDTFIAGLCGPPHGG